MSTNTKMNFGPAWMRGEAARASRAAESEAAGGRSSPTVSNGLPQHQQQPPDPHHHTHLPGMNGTSSHHTQSPQRATSFSYSSVLASQPPSQIAPSPLPTTNTPADAADKPFKYTRDEMLNIWRANSSKWRGSGIPLEFEKHEAFTSEDPLEPALLTEMTSLEREAFSGPLNSDKPDAGLQARLDRASTRQYSPRTERFPAGSTPTSTRTSTAPRNRTLSRGEPNTPTATSFASGPHPAGPRPSKSREYFAGTFGGSPSTLESSPPEKDIWGSATKKGSFDENGKFVVTEDDKPLEQEDEEEPLEEETQEDLSLEPPTMETAYAGEESGMEGFGLPAVGGRTTSRFSQFGLADEQGDESLEAFADTGEDDVLKDILNMTSDPRAISPPRQIERLSSRFATQSLSPNDPSAYSAFSGIESFEPIRRDSGTLSQFFPHQQGGPPFTKPAGLFEHPVVPSQPTLPPVPPQTTRVMIMADKLKWVYKDPHGNVQGPFTGLEMHEWYRGGYFHPTLEVKREDDGHFDQLQQLVKKIGNQREPFLVPLPSKTQTQVIPPRSTTTLSGWNTTLFGEPVEPKDPPWMQPPVQGPALTGSTLTADQQNALERRKQEEQYMLVRQREMAAIPAQPVPPAQPFSQPLHPFMAGGYPGYGGLHGLPMGVTHHVHSPAPVQVQTLPALDTLRTTPQPVVPSQTVSPADVQRYMSPWGGGPLGVNPMQLHQEQFSPTYGEELPQAIDEPTLSVAESMDPGPESRTQSISLVLPPRSPSPIPEPEPEYEPEPEPPTDFPSQMESPPAMETVPALPAISPARTAPWAQKKDDPKKALSLKEIQDLEAKRAAEVAKRVAAEKAEQQALLQAQQAQQGPVAVQAGLPANSTWGGKSWGAKVAVVTPGKKSMAQIQKEEEEERARIASKGREGVVGTPVRGYAGAAATSTPKPAMPTPTAWTMVGPGGRPQPGRPIHSGGINPNIPPQPTAPRPTPPRQPSLEPKSKPPAAVQSPGAVEDFQKWCRTQLKSLTGVNYDEFYQMIISLPPNEPESQQIIADAIYNHSSTLNGQHFAEEFLKKRKTLGPAVDAATPGTSPVAAGGGWNEVLKKEKAVKDPSGEWNSAFKVVAGKKGRRRG